MLNKFTNLMPPMEFFPWERMNGMGKWNARMESERFIKDYTRR